MSPKNQKLSQTQKVMSGILIGALTLSATACSTGYEEDYYSDSTTFESETVTTHTENTDTVIYEESSDDVVVDDVVTEIPIDIELDHLQSQYPNIDLEAVEQHLEETGEFYNEEELLMFLEDIEVNGEPTYESYYSSSFPWWLFLLSSHPRYSAVNSGSYTKPSTSTTVQTGTTTKTSSGFGSSSPATGS